MRKFETLTLTQLVDKLADTTEQYTRIVKESRNTDDHFILRDEIQQLVTEIELRRTSDEAASSDRNLPENQFSSTREL